MAKKFHQELRLVKVSKKDYGKIQQAISSSANVHRWINQGATSAELLKAIKVEVETKKRYAIIKRLHQRYTKTRAQDEFMDLELLLD